MIKALKNKRTVIYIVLILMLIIQLLPSKLKIFGVEPNYLIAVLVIASFYLNEKECALLGFVTGAITDIQASYIGLNAVFYMFLLYFVSIGIKFILRRNFVTFSSIVLMALIILNLLNIFFYGIIGERAEFNYAFLYILLPNVLVNYPISALFYLLFYYFRNRLFRSLWERGKPV